MPVILPPSLQRSEEKPHVLAETYRTGQSLTLNRARQT